MLLFKIDESKKERVYVQTNYDQGIQSYHLINYIMWICDAIVITFCHDAIDYNGLFI